MTVLDFQLKITVRDLRAGDVIVDGEDRFAVSSVEKTKSLVTGGPGRKTAAAWRITLESGNAVMAHPSNEVRIIRR